MDNLTHSLAGALLGAALPAEREGGLPLRARAVLCAGITNLPDIDTLTAHLVPGATRFEQLSMHRGITHSFLMAPLWGALVGLLAWYALRRRWSLFELIALSIAAFLLHDALDLLTSYGTQVFAPLSDRPLALPLLFIIDPWLWLLLGAATLLTWRRGSVAFARGGLLALGGYVALCGALMLKAESAAATAAERANLPHQALVLPQPFSPGRWKVVVADGDMYHTAYLDLFRNARREPVRLDAPMLERVWNAYQPADALDWTHRHRYGADPLMRGFARFAWGREELTAFRRFALLPQLYAIRNATNDRGCGWYADLRFEVAGAPNPFTIGICHGPVDGKLRKSVGWELARDAGPPAIGF